MAKFLDSDGLLYLWGKIKTLLSDGLLNKVDKINGKGLSTNDYTSAEKTKLGGIETGAEENQNAFSSILANGGEYVAQSKEATLSISGGEGITPAAGSGGLIISLEDSTTSKKGAMSSVDKGRLDNLYARMAGYATTAGTTGAYTATIAGAKLTAGTMVTIRFNAANAANATLNLNSLGAKPIYYKGAAVSAGKCPANAVMLLVYDTTQVTDGAWHLIYSYDSGNTTYGLATESTNGLMSSTDKKKVNGVEDGAQKNQNAFGIISANGGEYIAQSEEASLQMSSVSDGLSVGANSSGVVFALEAATTTKQGAMLAADKVKLNALPTKAVLDANYAKKSDITNMYKYKGSVATESSLPKSGQTAGDVYNIEATSTYGPAGTNVAWTGTNWDALGGLFTIESITNAEIDSICV